MPRSPTASLAAFVDAQQRLRDQLGADIVFWQDPVITLPPGTPVDPETGVAYDPTIVGSATAGGSAMARCSVVYGITGVQALQTAIGVDDVTHVVLITASAAASAAADAASFDWSDERYAIIAQKPDIKWQARWLIFGRRR